MTEFDPPAGEGPRWAGLLDPTTRAVAGFVLAVAGLLGPNVLQTAVQVLLNGPDGGDPQAFFVATGVATAVPLGLGVWLAADPARSAAPGWVASLAKAAVVIGLLGLAGAVLIVLGALVRGY